MGPTLLRARTVYTAVVRPAMIYAASMWHTPGDSPKGVVKKLQSVQNRCLRVVAGAYKATAAKVLEVETNVPPLDLYLNSRVLAYANKIQKYNDAKACRVKACEEIR